MNFQMKNNKILLKLYKVLFFVPTVEREMNILTSRAIIV